MAATLNILEDRNFLKEIIDGIQKDPRNIIAILGPTCSGKTSLALALAEKLGFEIINADSRLVFREMSIGTAKPSEEELSIIKHHLIDIRNPDQNYSAAEYRSDFDLLMRKLDKAIVVGGTGLYLRAALEDLDMPAIPQDYALREDLQAKSLEDLQAELKLLDPDAVTMIDMKNKVRLIRAIEQLKSSGLKLADLRKKLTKDRYDAHYIGLNYHSRDTLYELINKRVLEMIDKGLVQEVQLLLKKYGVTPILMNTIGYGEIINYLQANFNLDEAIALIQQRTRIYAKKQITWFKANPRIKWYYRD
jgi:tRNA dimethylallyltransferase